MSDAEAAARRRRRAAAAFKARAANERRLDEGYEAWLNGLLCPAAIRLHMDACGAEGPEVDRACAAEEPEVDEWELGVRYPTWEQTLALCNYLSVVPMALVHSPAYLGHVILCPPPKSRDAESGDGLFDSPDTFEPAAVRDVVAGAPARRPVTA